MAPYQYQPLDESKKEIRVLHLHPGTGDDALRISISHVPFNPSEEDKQTSYISDKKFEELKESLPHPWNVFRTLEGRPIFFCWQENDKPQSSWEPPKGAWEGTLDDETETTGRPKFEQEYEAVSYTWGSVGALLDVEVVETASPLTTIGTLNVGPNLHEMLMHLRQLGSTRVLWIDAICINQDDVQERSKQIKSMGNIYSFASRVIVWLGESDYDSTVALRKLEYIGKQLEYTRAGRFLPSPHLEEPHWWDTEHRIILTPEEWGAIANLIQRPWFARLWIMQEIQLANQYTQVQCGEANALWYHLRRGFLRCLVNAPELPQSDMASFQNRSELVYGLLGYMKLSDIKYKFQQVAFRNCSDRRDKVFAILALLPPSLSQRIPSDYASPVGKVYMQAFLAIVDATHRLALLDFAGIEELEEGFPSWAPAFGDPSYGNSGVYKGSFTSSHSAGHASFRSPNQLHVRGIAYDYVKATSPAATEGMQAGHQALQELGSYHFPHTTEKERLDAYMWILTEGDLSDRFTGHELTPDLEEAKAIFRQVCEGKLPEMTEAHEYWYWETMTDLEPDRFFVTHKGLFGSGSLAVEIGDRICILLGYDAPMLLRPTTTDNHAVHYRVVGPVYVHGLMEGQAILGPLPPPWKMIIHIRTSYDYCFYNSETEEETRHDPRLGALPSDWEEIEKEDEFRLGYIVQHYRNKSTGEVINSDPRLLPEALEARGVNVETFILV